jgi:hypothetical protein
LNTQPWGNQVPLPWDALGQSGYDFGQKIASFWDYVRLEVDISLFDNGMSMAADFHSSTADVVLDASTGMPLPVEQNFGPDLSFISPTKPLYSGISRYNLVSSLLHTGGTQSRMLLWAIPLILLRATT